MRFVLIHGAWHDGSTWGDVIRYLSERGHEAYAPTLAGNGKGVDKRVSHADCVASVVNYVRAHDLTDFVLVGHSYGGTIIAKAAEEIPERIRRLVFFVAFVLPDGGSLTDEVSPQGREQFAQLAAQSPDGTVMLPFDRWHRDFIHDADETLARAAYERLSPQPFRPMDEQLDLKRFYRLNIPKSYLYCTGDLGPGDDEQHRWHPRQSSRLGNFRLVTMPGSHEVMFTNPRGLAEKLIEAGRD